jgi:hypothetical protein
MKGKDSCFNAKLDPRGSPVQEPAVLAGLGRLNARHSCLFPSEGSRKAPGLVCANHGSRARSDRIKGVERGNFYHICAAQTISLH